MLLVGRLKIQTYTYKMHNKTIYFFLILFTWGYFCHSQNFRNSIIKDINTNNSNANIEDYVELNGEIYFINFETNEGINNFYTHEYIYKLWKYDQTTHQPILIKELSINSYFSYAKIYKTIDNFFYIEIAKTNIEVEIWYSDGTSLNTSKLITGFRKILQIVNSTLYLLDNDETKLYRYDFGSTPQYITTTLSTLSYYPKMVFDNKLLYIAMTSSNLISLFSVNSNNQVETLFSSSNNYEIYLIGIINNKFIFSGYDSQNQTYKLFSYDGFVVNSYYSLSGDQLKNESGFATSNKLYFFTYQQGLMATDGTTNNTHIVNSSRSVEPLFPNSNTAIRNKFLYKKNIVTNSLISELWCTDGISNYKLKDTIPNHPPFDYGKLATYGNDNIKYFALGSESIYKYDFASNSITNLKFNFARRDYNLQGVGDGVLFEAELQNSNIGSELYLFQNNALNLINDFNTNTRDAIMGNIHIIEDYIFYEANNSDLVVSKGLEENTFKVTGVPNSGISTQNHVKINDENIIFFNFLNPFIFNTISKNINTLSNYPNNLTSTINSVMQVNNKILIWLSKKIYSFDAQNYTYELIKDFSNAPSNYQKSKLFNGLLYFILSDSNTSSLWKTDGTTNGTTMVYSWNSDNFRDIFIMNNQLIINFSSFSDTNLWKSDGTAIGTAFIAQFPTDYDYYNKLYLNFGQSSLFFQDESNFYKSVIDQNNNRYFYRTNNSMTGIELLPSNPIQLSNSKAFCKCKGKIYSFTYDNKLWEFNPIDNQTILKHDFGNNTVVTPFDNIIGNPICLGDILWLSMVNSRGPWRLAAFNIMDNSLNWFDDQYVFDLDACCSRIFKNNMVVYKNSILYPKIDKKYGREVFKIGTCDNGITRQGITNTGDYYYENRIESIEKIVSPQNINLFSNKSITLLPGFESRTNSYFYSAIKECK